MKLLQGKLQAELDKASLETSPVSRYDKSMKLTKAVIEELKGYIATNPFADQAAEIRYYKTLAPFFYSSYFFFIKAYNLEIFRLSASKDNQLSFMEQELKAIAQFFSTHGDFVRYFYMAANYLDEQLFTRQVPETWMLDEVTVIIDSNFCLASYRVSCILANERYRGLLEEETERLKNPQHVSSHSFPGKRFDFMGSCADATELIYALGRRQLVQIDGVNADIKALAQAFEEVFQKKLGNIYEKNRLNQLRKKDKTPFLNSLIRALQGEGYTGDGNM